MQNLTDKFFAVLKSLSDQKVDYILVGGFAMVLHGVLRLTQDIGIFIRNDEINLEKLRKALSLVLLMKALKRLRVLN